MRTLAVLSLLVGISAPAVAGKSDAVLEGTVKSTSKTLLAGIEVTVTAPGSDAPVARVTTDPDGQFSITLPKAEGTYVLALHGDGYLPFDAEVELTPGTRTSVVFALLEEGLDRKQRALAAYNEGAALFNQAAREAARERFVEALNLDPDLHAARLALGDILYGMKDLGGAAEHIDRYLLARPDDVDGLSLQYSIYRERGDRGRLDALVTRLAATDRAGAIAVTLYNDGAQAFRDGDETGALSLLERALELDPGLHAARGALATIHYNAQRLDRALEMAHDLERLDPGSIPAARLLFLVHDARRDPEAAAALDKYADLDPDAAVDLLYQRAELEFRTDNRKGAITLLERVLSLRPDMALAHYTLGMCHATGDKARARTHLKRFLELAPESSDAGAARQMLAHL